MDRQLAAAHLDAAERGGGVGGHRRADVAALGVLDDEQPGGARVRGHLLERVQAGGAEGLEEGRLRLDRGRDLGDAVDHRGAEAGGGLRRPGEVLDAVEQLRRQLPQLGVEPDDEQALGLLDAGDQAVGEVDAHRRASLDGAARQLRPGSRHIA